MRVIAQFSLLVLLMLSAHNSFSQRYDNTWLWGIYPQYQDEGLIDINYAYYGNAHGTFDNDTFVSEAKFRGMTFSERNISISHPNNGNLLFYSNGQCVRDTSAQIILNGDSLGYGVGWWPENGGFGGRGPWCLETVPFPDNDSMYKIVYWNYGNTPSLATMCYADLKITVNEIKLTSKDYQFSNVIPEFGGVAACKHGNGRDWWVLFMEANTNCFHKYLLTADTFALYSLQCIGRSVHINDLVKNVFSPDGSKMLRTSLYGASDIFDFDRCSGELSNFFPIDTFHVIDTTDGSILDGINSGEISPNNRFLYLNSALFVLQHDLLAPDINLSRDTVGIADLWIDTMPHHSSSGYGFNLSQYSPDGKIFLSPNGAKRFFSTIETPNGKGDSCNFKLRSIATPKWVDVTIPYFPNYRLGRSIGSACDTVYSDIKPLYKETPWLKLYPNPATHEVRVDYNWVEWEKIADCELKIADLEGRVMYEQAVPRYSTRQDVNVKELPQGVYTVTMQDGAKKIAVCKLTVVR